MRCALVLAACAPAPDGPFQAEVVRFDPGRGSYAPGVVEVSTLTDLETLDGSVVRLIAAADFRLDHDDLLGLSSLADFRSRVLLDPGRAPSFAGFERDGVVRGQDFHSINLLTTYWNFERANLWFAARGLAPAEVGKLDVYYFPRFVEVVAGEDVVQTDNALFYPAFQAFLVLPFAILDTLPLSMNEGVVAHEYSHAVFNARVFAGEPVPWLFERLEDADADLWGRQINVIKSLDEGLADFFGGAVVGDPSFIARSIPELREVRDPRPLRCASQELRDAFGLPFDQYDDPYAFGTVLHHVLFSIGGAEGPALAALPAFAQDLHSGGPHADERQLLARVIALLPAERRAAACGLAADRFRRVPSEFPGCTASTPPAERCP